MSDFNKINLTQARALLAESETSIAKLDKEKLILQERVASLLKEKTEYLVSSKSLQQQLDDSNRRIDALKLNNEDYQRQVANLIEQNKSLRDQVQQQTNTLEQLRKSPDAAYKTEYFSLQEKYFTLSTDKDKVDADYLQLQKAHLELRVQLDSAKKNAAMFETSFAEVSKELENEKKENEVIKKAMGRSFSPTDLSTYLNKTISDFNQNSDIKDCSAKYIINSMDVDLRAQVYRDEDENIMFCAPDIEKSTDNSLSSVKVSIRAIPK